MGLEVGKVKVVASVFYRSRGELLGEIERVEGCGEPIVFKGDIRGILYLGSHGDYGSPQVFVFNVFSPIGGNTIVVSFEGNTPSIIFDGAISRKPSATDNLEEELCWFLGFLTCREKVRYSGAEICGLGVKNINTEFLRRVRKRKNVPLEGREGLYLDLSYIMLFLWRQLLHYPFRGDLRLLLSEVTYLGIGKVHPDTKSKIRDFLWGFLNSKTAGEEVYPPDPPMVSLRPRKQEWALSLLRLEDRRLPVLIQNPKPILRFVRRVIGDELYSKVGSILERELVWIIKNTDFKLIFPLQEAPDTVWVEVYWLGKNLFEIALSRRGIWAYPRYGVRSPTGETVVFPFLGSPYEWKPGDINFLRELLRRFEVLKNLRSYL